MQLTTQFSMQGISQSEFYRRDWKECLRLVFRAASEDLNPTVAKESICGRLQFAPVWGDRCKFAGHLELVA